MCNDYGNRVPYSDYVRAFREIRLPVVLPAAAPNLEPRDDIWPTETAAVLRRQRRRARPASMGIRAATAEGTAGHQLPRADWAAWLDFTRPERELL